MKTNLIIFFVLSYFLISTVYSQVIEDISVEFTRILSKNGSEEVVKGNIYYQASKRTILKITEPIHQWMVIESNTMLIYYPNDKKAFRYTSKNPFSLPFFQVFVMVSNEDWGLSKSGYTISSNESKGDTLFVHWKPSKVKESILGEFVLGLKEDCIVLTELKGAKGETLVKTRYSNHIHYGSHYFPLYISSIRYSDNNITMESITFSNPIFNEPFPEEIVNFSLPQNIEVKEIEW